MPPDYVVVSAPGTSPAATGAGGTKPNEPLGSIEAHRQRESKWMAALAGVSPAQARKSKKVRKLLVEGVPSSVRYRVWCHLTDCKARALPGVYAALGKRAHVPVFGEIVEDAEGCFPEQAQLHGAKGPLVSLLQAYLTMVPDIQYSPGLSFIAGHLLLLAPEEDAFWIFVSTMDAHLRPYFSTNTIQMEVDAALFSKALESGDGAVGKKLLINLSIPPANLCRSWFSGLFVGTLSVEFLHRVWDVFLFEGVPFLFRVGLALIQCTRHLLLQATSEEAVIQTLRHPPSSCLPSTADGFLALALAMKLKDDEVRKQRVKMEAQVKRQTQLRPSQSHGTGSVQTSKISLPALPQN
ncbi:RabGAP TBC [Coniophora puteana RWD-64-598 SS2]|uniref:RabGAP TBC n=1 Tax=Coniophora puteana (strain RWD-64-598) TaxID=741705 RepID=A0A5M3MA90_CONPW|nr:RabGAP TBC [Coniophora puteana RWD-64-598 SS2]EIW75700.1 RabGAP TBC [Coniophora puteana RWD-64-598 SS2]